MPGLLLASPKCGDQRKFLHDDPAATAATTLSRRHTGSALGLCGTQNQETEEAVTAMTASRLRHA